MPALDPDSDAPCDVHNGDLQKTGDFFPGCTSRATLRTDGTEKDGHFQKVASTDPDLAALGIGKHVPMSRPSVPNVFVCEHHRNWPHSEDAQAFAKTPVYITRQKKNPLPSAPAAKKGA